MQLSNKKTVAVACCILAAAAAPATASEGPGPDPSVIADYLAARFAAYDRDFDVALGRLSNVTELHLEDPLVLHQLLGAAIGSGDRDRAFEVARKLEAIGEAKNEIAVSALAAADFLEGRFDRVLERYQGSPIDIVPAYETILQGWIHHVDENYASADQTFLGHDSEDNLLSHVLFQHALSLALRGDLEEAARTIETVLERSGTNGGIPLSLLRDFQIAQIQLLAALGQVDDARVMSGLAEAATTGLPADRIKRLRERLDDSETFEFDFVRSPSEAMALFIADISRGVGGSGDLYLSLIYARLASFLMPDSTMRQLEVAEVFKDMRGWRMADSVYSSIPETDPHFGMAVIGRADALYRDERVEDALSSLRDLVDSESSSSAAQMALGDMLRMEKEYEASLPFYDRAIELMEAEQRSLAELTGNEVRPIDWIPHHFRAVSLERTGNWAAAKSEFYQTLELSGNNPYVLNYLGYTLADRNEELEIARDLIAAAVEQMPENGAFIDSLGWVNYRMENYETAVDLLETAIRLEPQDPVVLDHLGDAYWMVDRRREAKHQWQQALTYESEWTDESLISRKLEFGLDAVLSE